MKKILSHFVLLLILLTIASLMMSSDCGNDDGDPKSYAHIKLLTPVNGSTNIPTTVEFTWELVNDSGENFYEYDLYIDDHTPPTTIVATHLSLPSHFATLLPNTNYTWKVVGIDYSNGSSVEVLDLWQFRTGQ